MQIKETPGANKTATERTREVRPREVEQGKGSFGKTNLSHECAEAPMST